MEENVEIIVNDTTGGSLEETVSDVVQEVTEEVLEYPSSETIESEPVSSEKTSGESVTDTETVEEILAEGDSSEEIIVEEPVASDLSYETLQEIHTTLLHVDSVAQYGVSIIIALLVIVLCNYAYKFFKMFF